MTTMQRNAMILVVHASIPAKYVIVLWYELVSGRVYLHLILIKNAGVNSSLKSIMDSILRLWHVKRFTIGWLPESRLKGRIKL